MFQAEAEPNYFFLSDQKVFVKFQGNIQGFSRQGELYNGQKWALKYLKVPLQNEGNMPYYFLCDCQSNTVNINITVSIIKNICAKFHNKPNYSEEIESQSNTVNINITVSIIKNICAKFHNKPNDSQEIEKKYLKTDQKIPQNGLQERRTCCENFFQCSKHWSNTKTSLQTFFRQGFPAPDKQRNSNKMSPKITKQSSSSCEAFLNK